MDKARIFFKKATPNFIKKKTRDVVRRVYTENDDEIISGVHNSRTSLQETRRINAWPLGLEANAFNTPALPTPDIQPSSPLIKPDIPQSTETQDPPPTTDGQQSPENNSIPPEPTSDIPAATVEGLKKEIEEAEKLEGTVTRHLDELLLDKRPWRAYVPDSVRDLVVDLVNHLQNEFFAGLQAAKIYAANNKVYGTENTEYLQYIFNGLNTTYENLSKKYKDFEKHELARKEFNNNVQNIRKMLGLQKGLSKDLNLIESEYNYYGYLIEISNKWLKKGNITTNEIIQGCSYINDECTELYNKLKFRFFIQDTEKEIGDVNIYLELKEVKTIIPLMVDDKCYKDLKACLTILDQDIEEIKEFWRKGSEVHEDLAYEDLKGTSDDLIKKWKIFQKGWEIRKIMRTTEKNIRFAEGLLKSAGKYTLISDWLSELRKADYLDDYLQASEDATNFIKAAKERLKKEEDNSINLKESIKDAIKTSHSCKININKYWKELLKSIDRTKLAIPDIIAKKDAKQLQELLKDNKRKATTLVETLKKYSQKLQEHSQKLQGHLFSALKDDCTALSNFQARIEYQIASLEQNSKGFIVGWDQHEEVLTQDWKELQDQLKRNIGVLRKKLDIWIISKDAKERLKKEEEALLELSVDLTQKNETLCESLRRIARAKTETNAERIIKESRYYKLRHYDRKVEPFKFLEDLPLERPEFGEPPRNARIPPRLQLGEQSHVNLESRAPSPVSRPITPEIFHEEIAPELTKKMEEAKSHLEMIMQDENYRLMAKLEKAHWLYAIDIRNKGDLMQLLAQEPIKWHSLTDLDVEDAKPAPYGSETYPQISPTLPDTPNTPDTLLTSSQPNSPLTSNSPLSPLTPNILVSDESEYSNLPLIHIEDTDNT